MTQGKEHKNHLLSFYKSLISVNTSILNPMGPMHRDHNRDLTDRNKPFGETLLKYGGGGIDSDMNVKDSNFCISLLAIIRSQMWNSERVIFACEVLPYIFCQILCLSCEKHNLCVDPSK